MAVFRHRKALCRKHGTIGGIQAGTNSTVIPETAVLQVTVRAVSEASRNLAIEGLRRVAEHVAAAHLCRAEIRSVGVA